MPRQPAGSPTGGQFAPTFRSEADVALEPDALADAVAFAEAYCEAAGGARPGTCYPAAWNIRDEFGWPIVEGFREGRPHAWNQMPDSRFFDPTAAQFGDPGPVVTDPDDPRYTIGHSGETAGPWVTFDDLPPEAQAALRVVFESESSEAQEAYARTSQWQIAHVDVAEMKARIMSAEPDLVDDHGSFEAYHAWYCASAPVPDHGESRWPCIEAKPGTGEYLVDGWHRFHSYVRAGDATIPVLRGRDSR